MRLCICLCMCICKQTCKSLYVCMYNLGSGGGWRTTQSPSLSAHILTFGTSGGWKVYSLYIHSPVEVVVDGGLLHLLYLCLCLHVSFPLGVVVVGRSTTPPSPSELCSKTTTQTFMMLKVHMPEKGSGS